MIDYNLSTGDARVQGGDIVMISGNTATAQRIEQKLRLWRGEWFLDRTVGFPWLRDILGQKPRPEVIRSLIYSTVVGDPGIRSIASLSVDIGSDRRLSIEFSAVLSSGETETMEFVI